MLRFFTPVYIDIYPLLSPPVYKLARLSDIKKTIDSRIIL